MGVATDLDPGSPEESPKDPRSLGVTKTDGAEIEQVEDEGPKRFIEKGPHVLQDTETRLFWMKKDSWLDKGKYFNWHESKDYALAKNVRKIGGFDDWRLPTPEEAGTLYNEEFENTAKGDVKIFLDKTFPEGPFKTQWLMADTSTKRPRFDYTNGKVMQADEYAFGSVRLCRREPVKKDDRRVKPIRR